MTEATDLRLAYTRDELMAEHDYAEPHVIAGRRMHGGFLTDGTYTPPRTKVRGPAIDAWTEALRSRGGDLFDAHASLLDGQRLPTVDQSLVLLRNDLGESFWNTLTIIGKIEAKGRLLADITFPDLQDVIVEDISEMAIGHLNNGLLVAHGLDEGGQPDDQFPERSIGGHDEMWFVARDLAFGEGAHADVEPPENIGREDTQRRILELPPEIEGLVSFLANLLLIEFRAELGFSESQAILRTPDVFTDRRAEAEEAADIIGRIRTDEEIHVTSLRLYLGEIRSCTFRTVDGGTIAGAEVIDRFWHDLVTWATVDQPLLQAEQQREVLVERIMRHADSERVLVAFDAAG